MEWRTTSAIVLRVSWLRRRRKRLATAAKCLDDNGWTIEHLRPSEIAVMGWTGDQGPGEGRQPPLPECFLEFMP